MDEKLSQTYNAMYVVQSWRYFVVDVMYVIMACVLVYYCEYWNSKNDDNTDPTYQQYL